MQPAVLMMQILILFLLPSVACAEVYKCVEEGHVSYSSSPCKSGSVPYDARRASISDTSADSVTIFRDATGRFSLPGSVNGVATTFTIDTGATFTTISGDLAVQMGIHQCVQVGISRTANGDTPTCRVTATNMSVGDFKYSNVIIYLNPTMQGGALLGNDLLSGFRVHQQGSVMVLSR